jgi:hypothetical protein
VITVNGDTATSFAYWFAMTNNTTHGQIEILYMGHYEDQLVRVDGDWKFKKRVVYNESRDNRALFYPGLGERDPRGATDGLRSGLRNLLEPARHCRQAAFDHVCVFRRNCRQHALKERLPFLPHLSNNAAPRSVA